ncbi:hypothetical protein [Pedobacter zeae]|uniref:Uncharacterized protein n=1 Tax=Pedobacter zeae TaxID=1737356 RepID=A0A7W6K777_9SPHI|nr:hypothetical protein [Pedobacter zeae]MBB4106498.1 hypothetical protein [Pedobacter zeae]GGH02074.1 hypothetical protein GCM10007422_16240 [Pedobacter zeae]
MDNRKHDQVKLKSDFKEEDSKHAEEGLNQWNDRLDENLEPEDHNDIVADQKAKDFSEKYGSGDQSDQGNH